MDRHCFAPPSPVVVERAPPQPNKQPSYLLGFVLLGFAGAAAYVCVQQQQHQLLQQQASRRDDDDPLFQRF